MNDGDFKISTEDKTVDEPLIRAISQCHMQQTGKQSIEVEVDVDEAAVTQVRVSQAIAGTPDERFLHEEELGWIGMPTRTLIVPFEGNDDLIVRARAVAINDSGKSEWVRLNWVVGFVSEE